MNRRVVWAYALLAVFCGSSAFAVTYIVPTDRDLVRRADAIVIGTAIESHAQFNSAGGIETVASISIEEVVKGVLDTGEPLQLVEMGGTMGDASMMIPGSPRYLSGRRYLLFLRHDNRGNWATWGFGLGKFELIDGFLVRGAGSDGVFGWDEAEGSSHVEPLREAEAFLVFVRTVSASALAPARDNYFVDPPASLPRFYQVPKPQAFRIAPNSIRPDYLWAGNYRWQNPTVSFSYCCSPFTVPPGLNGMTAINAGTSNWTNVGAGVHYTIGSANPAATHGLTSPDGINAILFNDPDNIVPNGIAALGGISNVAGTYQLADGFTYFNTTEVDVVIGKSFSATQGTFNALVTHELGHTLGFRHSDGTSDNFSPSGGHPGCVVGTLSPPCTNDAIMNHIVSAQALRQWDLDAVNTVYGSGPVCTAPSISVAAQAAPSTIDSGGSSQLSVGAAGSPTLSYQWYIGNPPSTATPTGSNSSIISVSPSSTTTYWVRVSNSCGSATADSTSVTVTVRACVAPQISQQPQASPASIPAGNSSQLSVAASGSSPSYQWYVGSSGDTSSPVVPGAGSTINVSPPATTIYWAQATNGCGTANGNAVTVTVTAAQCVKPTVLHQPDDQTVTPGTVTLFVGYNGTFANVLWYQGVAPDTSHFIGSGQSLQVPVAVTTQFWAQLSNCAGTTNSQTATITVTVVCTAPAITSATASPASVAPNGASTLTVVATGTSLTYQWYRGVSGDTSNPISGATATTTIVNPSATTSYWVRVSNGCGTADSVTIPLTVTTVCAAPAVTTQPLSSTVIAGQHVTLSVIASGSSLTYQWYQGAVDDTSTPLGTNDSTLTVQPLVNTSYWVKITNDCGTAKSNAATITANPSKRRAAHH